MECLFLIKTPEKEKQCIKKCVKRGDIWVVLLHVLRLSWSFPRLATRDNRNVPTSCIHAPCFTRHGSPSPLGFHVKIFRINTGMVLLLN